MAKDEIYQAPISLILSYSEKIGTRYSILLKQYAPTKDAFNFWQSVKKNTENLGSIFDAQPSVVTGNIHKVSEPSEDVIGFVGCSTIKTTRIFIDKSQLPQFWKIKYPYTCELDTLKTSDAGAIKFLPINQTILAIAAGYAINKSGSSVGYTYANRQCADCTIRGAHSAPPFWKF